MTNHRKAHRFFFVLLISAGAGGFREAEAKLPEFDAWDVVQIKGQRVGYERTTLRLADVDVAARWPRCGRSQSSACSDSAKETKPAEVELQRDTETDEGVLLDFRTRRYGSRGTTPMRTTVRKVVGNRLELQIRIAGTEAESFRRLAGEGWRHVGRRNLSLRTKPLKEGESALDRASQHRQSNLHRGNDRGEGNIAGRIAGREFPPC